MRVDVPIIDAEFSFFQNRGFYAGELEKVVEEQSFERDCRLERSHPNFAIHRDKDQTIGTSINPFGDPK